MSAGRPPIGTVPRMAGRHRVVVVGGGFGGLQCVLGLRHQPVDVTLVDRQNYHLFTPLLYQVASCLLNPSEIAAPLRKVLRRARNARFRQGEVVGVDTDRREVHLAGGEVLAYDSLVLATGTTTNYFGNDALATSTLGLKTLGEALRLRNHVLSTLERATLVDDADERRALLTFCVVGGGPTGVEYAGALAELVRLVLPHEYPEIARGEVRIVLLEGSDRVLPTFVPSLSEYARRELERLGVEVWLGELVSSASPSEVATRSGHAIPCATVVWTAGVRPSELVERAGLERGIGGRLAVDDHLRVPGAPGVYAIGDAAAATDRHGDVLAMQSPQAMQAGRFVARTIAAGLAGDDPGPFRYRGKGSLATIGRRAAVGQLGPLRLRGLVGWVFWLVVHLYYLIGFENRLQVLVRWAWYYVRYDRPIRSIILADGGRGGRSDRE